MTQSTDPNSQGMGALLADMLELDRPDPELFLRFADAPHSLSPEERQKIEWHLEHTPGCRAQLDLLRRVDFAALGHDASTAGEGAPSSAAVAPGPTPAERASATPEAGRSAGSRRAPASSRGRSRRWLYAAIPGAAAAAAVFWLQSSPEIPDAGPQTADSRSIRVPPAPVPTSATSEPRASEAARVTDMPPAPGQLPPPAEPSESRLLAQTAPETAAARPSPEASSNRDAEARTEALPPAQTPTTTTREPEAATTATQVAQTQATTTTEATSDSREMGPKIPRPQLLAMALPSYRMPEGADPRPRRSSTLRGASPQSPGATARIEAVVPEHVARTREARPALYWTTDSLPAAGSTIEFAIASPDAIDPLVRRTLPIPTEPGLQRIEFDTTDPELQLGVEYRWLVELRSPGQQPGSGELATGWIRRVQLTEDEATALDALPIPDRIAALANAGLWYDALDQAARLSNRFPNEPRVREALTQLLNAAGL